MNFGNNRMDVMSDERMHREVRKFLRNEAIKNGHSDIYMKFIKRSSDTKVWPYVLNGDCIGVAVTIENNIELFHVQTGQEGRRGSIIQSILSNMSDSGFVIASVTETDVEKRAFWQEVGFTPQGAGLCIQLQKVGSPVDLTKFVGEEKCVSVQFFDRSKSYVIPLAKMDGIGILSDDDTLHLSEFAVAFDGLPETNVGKRWVSVFLDGTLQVEARYDTVKSRELGLRRDAGGTPYIATIDLYTPKLFT
jgi:hypothetical protein